MTSLQSLPASATDYSTRQRREVAAAVYAMVDIWSAGMTDDFDTSFARIERDLVATLDLAQRRVVAEVGTYVPEVLAQTNPAALRTPAAYTLAEDALVGTAGSGLATDSLAYWSVIHAKTAIAAGASLHQALTTGQQFLATATTTLLADTSRTAEKVTAAGRRTTTFVRMLTPPSCGRCVILAGKPTRRREAFARHPGCDCTNIPAAENIADDLTTNPVAYLRSLDDDALAKALGSQANARAFTDGADPGQIVNAYRRSLTSTGQYTGGVRSAQVYGRSVKYTTEGTTRRGLANWRMRQAEHIKAGGEQHTGRYRSLRAPRLMPESIYQIATSEQDATRLLRLYGWIT